MRNCVIMVDVGHRQRLVGMESGSVRYVKDPRQVEVFPTQDHAKAFIIRNMSAGLANPSIVSVSSIASMEQSLFGGA